MAKVNPNDPDPFFSPKQDGKVDVKCSKALEDALRSAANQLQMKYPDLVRSILKQSLIGWSKDGKIVLEQVNLDKRKVSGDE